MPIFTPHYQQYIIYMVHLANVMFGECYVWQMLCLVNVMFGELECNTNWWTFSLVDRVTLNLAIRAKIAKPPN